MLLLLAPAPAQQQALAAELASLQNPSSPNYHQWLTPSAFAQAYANSPSDVAAVTAWLESQGFTSSSLAGRPRLDRIFRHGGAGRAGIRRPNPSRRHAGRHAPRAHHRHLGSRRSGAACRGTGLAGRSRFCTRAHRAAAARRLARRSCRRSRRPPTPPRSRRGSPRSFSISLRYAAQPQRRRRNHRHRLAQQREQRRHRRFPLGLRAACFAARHRSQRPRSRPRPGVANDQAEATLAASWAGAAAPGAQILLAPAATTSATDGMDLSLAAIVDQHLANVVAVGYSACEASLSPAHQAFYSALYQQAAAEGISIIAASGDSGAAACTPAGGTAPVTTGLAVNALASTPWNTVVGVAGYGSWRRCGRQHGARCMVARQRGRSGLRWWRRQQHALRQARLAAHSRAACRPAEQP